MKKLCVVLAVACGFFAVPSKAEVLLLDAVDDCYSSCALDLHCIQRCNVKVRGCLDCCHLKLPNASKEHCQVSCKMNLNSYQCEKR